MLFHMEKLSSDISIANTSIEEKDANVEIAVGSLTVKQKKQFAIIGRKEDVDTLKTFADLENMTNF